MRVTLKGGGDASAMSLHPSSTLVDSPKVTHDSLITFHEKVQVRKGPFLLRTERVVLKLSVYAQRVALKLTISADSMAFHSRLIQ